MLYNRSLLIIYFIYSSVSIPASLVAQTVKRLPAMQETRVQSLDREDPLRRKRQPTPVFLPGKSHGWRSLIRLQSMGSQRVGHD